MIKSGGGVLMVAAGQLLCGLCLLGVYEGYKAYYYNRFIDMEEDPNGSVTEESARVTMYESPLSFRSPMGFSWYLAIVNNVFALFGLAGVLNAQRELIIAFFSYNTAQVVLSFHYFVDLCTDAGIRYAGEPSKLSSYEQGAAALIFVNFALSASATFFAVRAVDEIRAKQREEYNRFTVMSDTLQFEPDQP